MADDTTQPQGGCGGGGDATGAFCLPLLLKLYNGHCSAHGLTLTHTLLQPQAEAAA
jgi:hypothetical protein